VTHHPPASHRGSTRPEPPYGPPPGLLSTRPAILDAATEHTVYGRRWNDRMRFMIDPIDPEVAHGRFDNGGGFTVAVGRGLATSVEQARETAAAGLQLPVPDYAIEMDTQWVAFSSYFFSDAGSVFAIYNFRRVTAEWLFLSSVTGYVYPDQASYWAPYQATTVTGFRYTMDGFSREETETAGRDMLDIIDRRDVPIDHHWEPYPKFGHWNSLGRDRRRDRSR
jgi:hypothetical protein